MNKDKRKLTKGSKPDAVPGREDLAWFSPIDEIIEEARNGNMFILTDDEGRENEGDLIMPAQMTTPDSINFMAKFGRGLICLALTRERVERLGLPLMPQTHASRFETAFTVSIEARDGVTTGISAPDRARTVAAAIDPTMGAEAISTPGHVFPLAARDGGVLVRAGHTEAAIDVARLAGLNPSAVICEIMNDDGTMSRLPELIPFARSHDLKIGSIASLIAFRRRNDRIVERLSESTFVSHYGGEFNMSVYVNKVEYAEHIALVKGDVIPGEPVLVRMHALNVLDDVLGDMSGGGGGLLQKAMQIIGDEGRGVVVLIREPRPTSLSDRVRPRPPIAEGSAGELRDYGVGAQILLDLGVTDMILLTNSTRAIVGLEGFGLNLVERRQITADRA